MTFTIPWARMGEIVEGLEGTHRGAIRREGGWRHDSPHHHTGEAGARHSRVQRPDARWNDPSG